MSTEQSTPSSYAFLNKPSLRFKEQKKEAKIYKYLLHCQAKVGRKNSQLSYLRKGDSAVTVVLHEDKKAVRIAEQERETMIAGGDLTIGNRDWTRTVMGFISIFLRPILILLTLNFLRDYVDGRGDSDIKSNKEEDE